MVTISRVQFHFAMVLAGHRVYVQGTSATPFRLLDALVEHGEKARLRDIELVHIHLEGDGKWNRPEYEG